MPNLKLSRDFILENGETIKDLNIAYHTHGTLNADANNVIWVFHALTANSDVLDWWKGLFGKDNLFDPAAYFIICANVIGSPYGTTQPSDLDFPQFSVRDIVQAHLALAEQLSIDKIKIAIGGSFGGNQALEFAYSYNGPIDNLILIASSAKESAWSIAVHETQRMAMKSDKSFGETDGGQEGMAAARAIGMLTYRTSEAFIETQTDEVDEKTDNFRASSYIKYQGEKFIKRFNALSYYYLSKCLDTHNIGRDRGGLVKALSRINIPTLIISIDTDILIPTHLQKEMADRIPDCKHKTISSEFGHDGFLVETEKLTKVIGGFLNNQKKKRAVLKFGGSSLKNGEGSQRSINIIKNEAARQPIALVVSARGKTTDKLIKAYQHAIDGETALYQALVTEIIAYQRGLDNKLDFKKQQAEILELLQAVETIGAEIPVAKDRIMAYGELMSALAITQALINVGLKSIFIDARDTIVTYRNKEEIVVDLVESKKRTCKAISKLDIDVIPVITGFIAIDEKGKTTTLGRNGSNYSAALVAKFITASEIQNWTDVNGVYSGHPKYVKNAVSIPHLSYREANELANFGASVLHSKTILPLVDSNIPLTIRNSYNETHQGTLIDKDGSDKGIKAVSLVDGVSLISIEGLGLSGKVGIDSRIFSVLSQNNISVRLISQASSERGIGFVIDTDISGKAQALLKEEFKLEIIEQDISSIKVNSDIAIIAITGRHNYAMESAIEGLRKNKIWIHLFSNSITGENISLVINNKNAYKALNLVHEYVIENTNSK